MLVLLQGDLLSCQHPLPQVLQKFPVVQHYLFGKVMSFEPVELQSGDGK